MSLHVGARVEARFEGKKEWYPGLVHCQNADGTYAIDYDDGDFEDSVAKELMRLCRSTSTDYTLLWLRMNLGRPKVVRISWVTYVIAQLSMLYIVRALGVGLLQLQLTLSASSYREIVRHWTSEQLTQYEDHFKVNTLIPV
jgi:hypothetical protein